jgi:hypothetical protein
MKTPPLFLTLLVALLTSCDDSQLKALQRQKMEAEAKVVSMQLDLDKAREAAKGPNPDELKAKISALEDQMKQVLQTLTVLAAKSTEATPAVPSQPIPPEPEKPPLTASTVPPVVIKTETISPAADQKGIQDAKLIKP